MGFREKFSQIREKAKLMQEQLKETKKIKKEIRGLPSAIETAVERGIEKGLKKEKERVVDPATSATFASLFSVAAAVAIVFNFLVYFDSFILFLGALTQILPASLKIFLLKSIFFAASNTPLTIFTLFFIVFLLSIFLLRKGSTGALAGSLIFVIILSLLFVFNVDIEKVLQNFIENTLKVKIEEIKTEYGEYFDIQKIKEARG